MGIARVAAQALALGEGLGHLAVTVSMALRLPDWGLAFGFGVVEVENDNAHGWVKIQNEDAL